MESNSKLKKARSRYKQLRDEQYEWLNHWKDIADYMLPRKGEYLNREDETQSQKGTKKHQKILNGTATQALRNVASGIQGGLTSPSRPWFVLSVRDQDRDTLVSEAVKEWLEIVRVRMMGVFSRSNFYGAVYNLYREMAAFGTAAMLIEEDTKTVIRCRPFTIGEFVIALDDNYRPVCLMRRFSMTARQMAEKFGKDKLSASVKTALQTGKGEDRFDIIHGIYLNEDMDPLKQDASGKEFSSVYFEDRKDCDGFLRESGYNSIPFVAPRWDVTGVNTYGDCPGMETLGDVKMLQKMEEKKLKGLDKMVDPPMNADPSLKGKPNTIVAGGVNYVSAQNGSQGFSPSYMVNLNLQNVAFEIDRVERRIEKFFFNDLFLMLSSTEKDMTATEVARRHEEKLQVLGPVIERMQSEFLDVIIDRTFNIMWDFGLIPPPPEELEGQDFKIEYKGLLAQAQKMVSTTGVEQVAAFVGQLAASDPKYLDKFDGDEAIDQYADMVGIPPKIIKSDDTVAQIRADREQQMQMQMAQEQAAQAAQTAKTMGDTPMDQGSALDQLLAGI